MTIRMVWTIGIGLLAAFTVACSGGSGGSGSTSTTAATAEVKGTVNQGEIGGTGMSVISAQQATSAPVQSGAFTTTVSTEGPQLLFLQDNTGSVRGLTISLPSDQTASSIMAADARSTTLALLFLSPGVTTSNTAKAQQIFAALQQMNSFGPLLVFLQTNLSTRALGDLVQDAGYQSLLSNCLTEWPDIAANLPPLPAASIGALAFAVPPKVTPPSSGGAPQAGEVSISADLHAKSYREVPVKVTNFGWRHIRVYKVAYDANNAFLSAESLPYQEGAKQLSLGNLIFGKRSAPSITNHKADFSVPDGVERFEYWVVGPGRGPCIYCPIVAEAGHGPEGFLNADDSILEFRTARDYVFFPLLSFLTGGGPIGNSAEIVFTSNDFRDALKEFKEVLFSPSGSNLDVARTLFNIFNVLSSALAEDGIVGWAKVLNPFNQIVTIANLANAVAYYATTPHVAKVEISTPYDTIQFERSSYSVLKTDRETKIIVTRIDGDHEDAASIKYEISGGDAIAGQDYIDKTFPTPGEMSFIRGQKTAEIALSILDNPENKDGRKTELRLLNDIEGPAKLGDQKTATLKIGSRCIADFVKKDVCFDPSPKGTWQEPHGSINLENASGGIVVDPDLFRPVPNSNSLVFSWNDPQDIQKGFNIVLRDYRGPGTYQIDTFLTGGNWSTRVASYLLWPALYPLLCSGRDDVALPNKGTVVVNETTNSDGDRVFQVTVDAFAECGGNEHVGEQVVGSFTTTPTKPIPGYLQNGFSTLK